MPIKLVVFDMAGTTVKDNHEVSKAFQAALKKSNYKVLVELIDPLMGYEKNQAIRQILHLHEYNDAKITNELGDKIHKDFVQNMISHYREPKAIEPLPHVEETFAKRHQRGVQVGINTGFSRDIADTIINRLQW